jgi:hypothetical protein
MKAFLFALICCSLLAGSGCNAIRPSPKNHYYTDYVVSQSYVLKQSVFFSLIHKDKDDINFLTKIGEAGLGAVPETLEQFQKNPSAWDVDLLPKGTSLKISRIKYTDSFEAGPHISIYAEILDGNLSDKICLLNLISKPIHKDNPLIDVPMIDTNILELVSKP